MKKCQELSDQLFNMNPGGLEPNWWEPFRQHLETCPHCRQRVDAFEKIAHLAEKRERPRLSDAYWDAYTENIMNRIDFSQVKPHRADSFGKRFNDWFNSARIRRLILAPIAAVIILAGGYYLGLVSRGRGDESMEVQKRSLSMVIPALNHHLAGVRPLLIGCINHSTEPFPDSNQTRSIVKTLLIENQLLRRVIQDRGDALLTRLLDELDLILTELANYEGDEIGTGAAERVKRYIETQNVLFKIKTLGRMHPATI